MFQIIQLYRRCLRRRKQVYTQVSFATISKRSCHVLRVRRENDVNQTMQETGTLYIVPLKIPKHVAKLFQQICVNIFNILKESNY